MQTALLGIARCHAAQPDCEAALCKEPQVCTALQAAQQAAALATAATASRAVAALAERRLQVELETGGNIRLEQGGQGDQWSESCKELLMARCPAEQLARVGLAAVAVQGTMRVHNRCLRNR